MNGRFEGKIFHLDPSGGLSESKEEPFALEEELERLIARHPGLLPGDQIDPESPRRWLLVDSQVDVPGDSTSWALDLLFVDQDAVPTLVEVKKGSNPELRRKVVGQMLDYAANAPIFWPRGSLRRLFESRAEREGQDLAAELKTLLGKEAAAEEFWETVDANLAARRIRLLFVTDRMVPELRRVVEFLNQSMAEVEVLAIEIRRYTGGGPSALVPTVYGQTLASEQKKSTGAGKGPAWTAQRFLDELGRRKGDQARAVAQSLLDWSDSEADKTWWGFGKTDGSFFPQFEVAGELVYPFGVWTYGKVEILFENLKRRPPFEEEPERMALRDRLQSVLGVEIPASRIDKRPSFALETLSDSAVRDPFLEIIKDVVRRVRELAISGVESP